MKFFIDTANVDEIREANDMGVLDGVTTNPSLIAKEDGKFEDILREICDIVDGPISAEVVSTDHKGMISEGTKLAAIHDNIVVKIPCIKDGLKASKALSSEGIGVNMTLVFSPSQAILAAKAGASFVSPFVGRLDDISHFGMEIVEQIVRIYRNYNFATEVLVASIRNPLHLVDAALMGADIATIPFDVIEKLVRHPLTDIGLQKFLADWEKVKARS
ncbi:MAG: fructose-6-phosphate aldolase [candidate division Zixibacteria bacterium]|nr:fructose-6-phosphate aldolase [candidate division Zixibacteria bacterium]MBU1471732.1 fructose-6-phosphate aldolase [candidate division Zixibacteria bacterium]MBU2625170.1 fructose-6-phosphate aldolase [candidate division Zixibacteria bacterium]